jgi:hypothetical protein
LTKDNEPRWLIPEASDDDLGTEIQMALHGGLLYTIDDELRILNTEDGSVEKTVELDLSSWDEDATHMVVDRDGSLLTTYQVGGASADRWLDSNFVLTTPHGQDPANTEPTTNLLVRYTSELVEVWRTHLGDNRTSVIDLAVLPDGEIVVLVSQLDSAAKFLDVEPRLSHLLRFSSTGTFLGAVRGEVNMGIDAIDVQPLSGLLVVALHTEGIPLAFPDADPTKNWGMVGTLPAFPVP